MFKNREDAGKKLALEIKKVLKGRNFVVAGITRGGVVLAKVISDRLLLAMSIIVVKKIGAPYNPELAIGAVSHNKTVYWDEELIERLGINSNYRLKAKKEKYEEVKNLEKIFSLNKKGLDFKDKRVILVDDGVATGATVISASMVIRKQKAKEIILATAVASKDSFEEIKKYFDKIVVLKIADGFSAVGEFYRDFPQVSDEEVAKLL